MLDEKRTLSVELCMGSSCFVRGNKEALPLIEEYLLQQGQEEAVELKGHLCADQCSQGPLLRINGQTYRGMTPEAALDLIRHWCEK